MDTASSFLPEMAAPVRVMSMMFPILMPSGTSSPTRMSGAILMSPSCFGSGPLFTESATQKPVSVRSSAAKMRSCQSDARMMIL